MLRTITSTIIPELRTSCRCYVRKAGNPGINKLAKHFKETDEIAADPEAFGDMESDFMEAHKTHKQYEHETKLNRQKIQNWIVGNKYFKQNEPNFLTYAEKEQIKLLYSRDPEEWNADKLAESFPATPETIEKILKSKWTAATSKRIERHDESVMKNWSLFNSGQLDDLNPTVREHIEKFSKRKPGDLKNLSTVVRPKRELPRPKLTEFASIISSSVKFQRNSSLPIESPQLTITSSSNPFKKPDSTNRPQSSPVIQQPTQMEDETYLTEKIYDKKPIRFQDLVRVNPEVEQDRNELLLHRVENPQGTGVVKVGSTNATDSTVQIGSKFEVNEVEINARDMINVSSGIREKIHIPRHLWKKGHTYKLKDCYYDDDGELLYRVPGMTGLRKEDE